MDEENSKDIEMIPVLNEDIVLAEMDINPPAEASSSQSEQVSPSIDLLGYPLPEEASESAVETSNSPENTDEPSTSKQPSKNRKPYKQRVPPHIRSLMGEANIRYARGDTEIAEKICYEVIRQFPQATEAFLTLSQILEPKDREKSLQLQFMAAVTSKADLVLWINTAERAIEQNNINLAISCYGFVISMNKDNCEVHKKRIELMEKIGTNKHILIRAYVRYVAALMQNNDPEVLQVSLKLAIFYSELKDHKKAIEILDLSFKKFPDSVTPEMVNIMLDLLINSENYTYCLDIFFQYCNIEMEVLIGEDNNVKILSCVVPENIPIDFRVKFIICLIKLDAIDLIHEQMKAIIEYPNLDAIADLHLDLAEALMSAKEFQTALEILTPLIEKETLALPAVWLKYGECLAGSNKLHEAEKAFEKVTESAPNYTQAKKQLADVLVKLDRIDDALKLLQQTSHMDTVDVALLLKRISILRQTERYDELFNDVELLLLRHCIKLRHYKELKETMYTSSQTEKLSRFQAMRDFTGIPEEKPITFSLTEEITIDEEYELFRDVLQLCKEQKKYTAMQRLAFTAATSSKFKNMEEIHLWAYYASVFNRDAHNAFALIRHILPHYKLNNFAWNLYGCVLQFGEALRQSRFLSQYTNSTHNPQIRMLDAKYCVESGNHKLAMMYYLNAIRKKCTSLDLLILGSVILQICSQKPFNNKEKLLSTSASLIVAYSNMRSRQVYEEIYYNLGRFFQHLGFMHIAEGYYEKVLKYENPLAEQNPSLSLKREAAFNLHLIYKESGNVIAARNVIMKYLKV